MGEGGWGVGGCWVCRWPAVITTTTSARVSGPRVCRPGGSGQAGDARATPWVGSAPCPTFRGHRGSRASHDKDRSPGGKPVSRAGPAPVVSANIPSAKARQATSRQGRRDRVSCPPTETRCQVQIGQKSKENGKEVGSGRLCPAAADKVSSLAKAPPGFGQRGSGRGKRGDTITVPPSRLREGWVPRPLLVNCGAHVP